MSTTAPNYHVLLKPVSTKPLQTITVPAINGKTVAGPCARIGEVDINFFDNIAMTLLTTLQIPANTLPLFLDYNTFLTSKKKYRDFELKFQVRLTGRNANSGVQLRSRLTNRERFIVIGPQADMGKGVWGSLYGE